MVYQCGNIVPVMEQNIENYIDIYCERLEPGLWAEPLNAITNASFFIAAMMAALYAHRAERLDVKSGILIILLCCIGTGSTLFHTFATKATMLSDVLPILFYQIAFIWLYALYVMRLPVIKVVGLFFVFLMASAGAEQIPTSVMNGSLSYAPAFLFLLGFGVWHVKTQTKERYLLMVAALTFAVSLTFRSIDMAVCDVFEIGTHFMWHILNGCVLYLTTRSFINVER